MHIHIHIHIHSYWSVFKHKYCSNKYQIETNSSIQSQDRWELKNRLNVHVFIELKQYLVALHKHQFKVVMLFLAGYVRVFCW
eukprot:m.154696 g.154696  ORF g.154696 m.154696 type:complete len:82 (-) comp13321_c2_seq1:757-1002(-)